MASGSGGKERDDYIPEPVHGHRQREDSNAVISTAALGSVAAEGRYGASSPLPSSASPVGEQGGGGGRDHPESSSAAAGADRKGKNAATALSTGGINDDEQGGSPRAKKTFLSKILNYSKNKVLCRKGINKSSTGSLSNEFSKRPHVAEQTIPFSQAIGHYREQIQMIHSTTGELATNGVKLCEDYSQFRTVEGDGECFYRSFIFSYLEQVLDRQDTDEELRLLRAVKEVAREHELLRWTSNFSRSCRAFEDLVKKVMSWKTQGLLNAVASTDSYCKQKLLNFFSTYDETENIFAFLRLAAAIRICSNRVEFEERIRDLGENCSLQDWCSRNVTRPRAVAGPVQIRALATALGVPLIVQGLSEGAGLDIDSGVSPVRVTLLRTYEHYDIIYEKMGRGRSRILAPLHHACFPRPRPRHVRDSINLCPQKPRCPRRVSLINWQSILREWPDDANVGPDSVSSVVCKKAEDRGHKRKHKKPEKVPAANAKGWAACLPPTVPELTTAPIRSDADLAVLDPETTRILLPSDFSGPALVSLLKSAYRSGFREFVNDDAFCWALLHRFSSLYGVASSKGGTSRRKKR